MITERMTRILPLFCLLTVFPGLPFAESIAEDPKERQMLQIAQKLRCAVCQNQPVSESNSGLARDMRAIIREQLAAGKNEEQIVDYFIARYGDYVLLKPRKTGTGFALWVLPPLVLVFAGGFAWLVMRSRTQTTTTDDNSKPTLSDEDRERIRRARKQHDEDDK